MYTIDEKEQRKTIKQYNPTHLATQPNLAIKTHNEDKRPKNAYSVVDNALNFYPFYSQLAV